MISEILDKKEQGEKTCFLVKLSLKEYILGLPENYKSYYIQREIVQNPYLDNLINTILSNGHIPSIVLVIDGDNFSSDSKTLPIESFQILDGLQRTHRLKVIWDTIQLLQDELALSNLILEYSRIKISREYSNKIKKIDSSSNILSRLIEFKKANPSENLEEKFSNNFIWFEVWAGLSPDDQVQKMLILNAGHKPVKTKHQLELLFNNLIPIIIRSSTPNFKLIKEKEISSIQHNKNRATGHFHFSHIISAVLSYEAGKPITTNVELIQKAHNKEFNDDEFELKYDFSFFETFIRTIVSLDIALHDAYKEIGSQWLGREVSIVGLFGALGKIAKENPNLAFPDVCQILNSKLTDYPERLNLKKFEKIRNELKLNKVNIGLANKIAIYNGLYSLLWLNNIDLIDWNLHFNGDNDEH